MHESLDTISRTFASAYRQCQMSVEAAAGGQVTADGGSDGGLDRARIRDRCRDEELRLRIVAPFACTIQLIWELPSIICVSPKLWTIDEVASSDLTYGTSTRAREGGIMKQWQGCCRKIYNLTAGNHKVAAKDSLGTDTITPTGRNGIYQFKSEDGIREVNYRCWIIDAAVFSTTHRVNRLLLDFLSSSTTLHRIRNHKAHKCILPFPPLSLSNFAFSNLFIPCSCCRNDSFCLDAMVSHVA